MKIFLIGTPEYLKNTYNKFLILLAGALFFLHLDSMTVITVADAQPVKKVKGASCESNRIAIGGAVELYYIEHPDDSTAMTMEKLVQEAFLDAPLSCPAGGRYVFDSEGNVYCTVCAPPPSAAVSSQNQQETGENRSGKSGKTAVGNNIRNSTGEVDITTREVGKETTGVEVVSMEETSEALIADNRQTTIEGEKTAESSESGIQPSVIAGKTGASDSLPVSLPGNLKPAENPPAVRTVKSETGTTRLPPAKIMNADDYNQEGIEHAQNGRYDEAVKAFEKAIFLNPSNPTYHYNLGLAYAKVGEIGKARDEFVRALKLKPDDPIFIQAVEKAETILRKGKARQ